MKSKYKWTLFVALVILVLGVYKALQGPGLLNDTVAPAEVNNLATSSLEVIPAI